LNSTRPYVKYKTIRIHLNGLVMIVKEFWTITEVIELFEVEDSFLSELEEEEIVCPICREESPTKLFNSEAMEKLRLAKILTEDMGVNLPGVEIILRMRQNMFEMKRQFDTVLEDLVHHMKETFPNITD